MPSLTPQERKRRQRSRQGQQERNRAKRRRSFHDGKSRLSQSGTADVLHLQDHNILHTISCPNSNNLEVRDQALINLTQFRDVSIDESGRGMSVRNEMMRIRSLIQIDLKSHEKALNPFHFVVCSGCGHDVSESSCTRPRHETIQKWLQRLEDRVYADTLSSQTGATEHTPAFCQSCVNALRRSKPPFGALCRGWPFDHSIPQVLSSLNKYERQLICLRLPCVYVWRSQGGFGQYASRGQPISFSNPVSDLAATLPRHPSKTFNVLLDRGIHIEVDGTKTRSAILWLVQNNPLYKDIIIDEDAFTDISILPRVQSSHYDSSMQQHDGAHSVSHFVAPTFPHTRQHFSPAADEIQHVETNAHSKDTSRNHRRILISELRHIETTEMNKGTQGPIDTDTLEYLSRSQTFGVEDTENHYHARLLIEHMLKPFKHRTNHMLPSYNAAEYLESYFPVLFPYGTGGVNTVRCNLATWVKHALSVHGSRFGRNIDFFFFLHSVLKRKRLTGLATHAPIRDKSNNAIVEVRDMLNSSIPSSIVAKRIEFLLRSGILNASFETVRGSAAYWATLKRQSWAFLTRFGPCQIFVTISAADLIDPYVYCQISKSLSVEDARKLSSKQRADLLATNPIAASTIFHRRVQSLFDNFFFGCTRPFGDIEAYLGRIEQQARFSPHLHLLLWLGRKFPDTSQTTAPEASLHSIAHSVADFVETFCTANLPPTVSTPQSGVSCPELSLPPSKYTPLPASGSRSFMGLSAAQRHDFLSRAYNPDVFDGSAKSNDELRGQILSTQTHRCNSYCRGDISKCRFHFPFPPQRRGSISSRSGDPQDHRTIALAPRRCPFINSTHPMLTAMCHANTDVTIVTGSIPESMYVCSYAVKADKSPLFSVATLNKLKNLNYGSDDRKLLGAIARNSSSLRTIGGQEAIDYLLDRPLVFSSVKTENVSTTFLLKFPTALSVEEAENVSHDTKARTSLTAVSDILPQLHADPNAAVLNSSYINSATAMPSSGCGNFFRRYMSRPKKLDELSASQFHEKYFTRKLRKGRFNYDEDMLFLSPSSIGIGTEGTAMTTGQNAARYIVEERVHDPKRPYVSHILNVPARGLTNEKSPYFAASALCLHVPFRSVPNLLGGHTLTQRLQLFLNESTFPELNKYVGRCQELSDALNSKPPRHDIERQRRQTSRSNELDDDNDDQDPVPDDDDCNANPLAGLPPLIACEGMADPLSSTVQWSSNTFSQAESGLQLDRYREYIKNCRSCGILHADRMVAASATDQTGLLDFHEHIETTSQPVDDTTDVLLTSQPESRNMDFMEVIALMDRIACRARNDGQKTWLSSVLSYLVTYYGIAPGPYPSDLLSQMRQNHPIFTNAPGGCGKSWLLDQVQLFVNKCIPRFTLPKWSTAQDVLQPCSRNKHDDQFDSFDVSQSKGQYKGRLGNVAVFAPSGVAAGNAKGFTFHNGLRAHIISLHKILEGPGDDVLTKLIDDFAYVSAIVIDEYSMVPLQLILYLDVIAGRVRPAFSNIPFGAIPVIITGDGLQLPVVNGLGILSDPTRLPSLMHEIHRHCTQGVFALELSQSIRQQDDEQYAGVLLRLRQAQCTSDDVKNLNTRVISDLDSLCRESAAWYNAPILTSKNKCVDALNNAAIFRNGMKLGTFHVHNMPLLRKSRTVAARKKGAESFFYRARPTSIIRSSSEFNPAPVLVVYPGMPVMLRSNICPAIGLFNGAIGQIVSVIDVSENLAHEPSVY